ncbi:MAG: site-specific DNA-methyltransferase, partial [Cyanobacteria bacterium REEB65]|nr:site-specific DNA-methyltransferase [Cyanobacteria bacterium REEB65]
MNGQLQLGDNLDLLQSQPDGAVDLIYLDPPFNSNAHYQHPRQQDSGFSDVWRWDDGAERFFATGIAALPRQLAASLTAIEAALGPSPELAYLAMLVPRLAQLHRVLATTGSLYLHCDPRASHWIRLVLDALFGSSRFRSEIVWKRSSAHNDGKQGRRQLGRVHDLLLYYTKGSSWTWNPQYTPYDPEYVERFYRHFEPDSGRRYRLGDLTGPGGSVKGNPSYEFLGVTRFWRYSQANMARLLEGGRIVQTKPGTVPAFKRYLDEMPGLPLQDVWTDIRPVAAQGSERTGYPTQKPEALLERIIRLSSHPGDWIL